MSAGNSEVTATQKKPRGRPFQKGKSGNPNGRPKGADDVRDLARTFTAEAIEKLASWMRSENAKASVAACSVLLDRAWGKAPQAITGEDGGGLVIKVVRYTEARA